MTTPDDIIVHGNREGMVATCGLSEARDPMGLVPESRHSIPAIVHHLQTFFNHIVQLLVIQSYLCLYVSLIAITLKCESTYPSKCRPPAWLRRPGPCPTTIEWFREPLSRAR